MAAAALVIDHCRIAPSVPGGVLLWKQDSAAVRTAILEYSGPREEMDQLRHLPQGRVRIEIHVEPEGGP